MHIYLKDEQLSGGILITCYCCLHTLSCIFVSIYLKKTKKTDPISNSDHSNGFSRQKWQTLVLLKGCTSVFAHLPIYYKYTTHII